jgi:predicted dehydrogenase
MQALTRRGFVVTAASAARVLGANERVRLVSIGCGGRGQHLMRMAKLAGGAEFVAVCDAWDVRRREAAAYLEKELPGPKVEQYADYRKVLELKDVDAVIVASTDHWHSRMTVDALHAGKDVFCEKPMTSLPEQGLEVVKAVRTTGKLVQVGVQQRSIDHFIEAKQRFFDSGMIGPVHLVRTYWNANSGYLTPVPPGMEAKPEGLDWQAVLGWLPKRPWNPKMYFNRFAYWEFSTGGQTGGLFVHMVDVVHWYLGLTKPVSCVALGGIYQYNDGRDTPDNINFILNYPQKLNVTFEATITDMIPRESADIVFFGEKGRLNIFRGGYRFLPAGGGEPIVAKGGPEPAHMGNFLDCVRSRTQPNANAVDGHYGAMACHVGNIAYRTRQAVAWKKEWDI